MKKLHEKIVKLSNGKWQVQSEKGRNMGTYDTKKEAEDRLKQVHYFKYVNEALKPVDLEDENLSDADLIICDSPYQVNDFLSNEDFFKINYYPNKKFYVLIDPWNATHFDVNKALKDNGWIDNIDEDFERMAYAQFSEDIFDALSEYSPKDFDNMSYVESDDESILVCLDSPTLSDNELVKIFKQVSSRKGVLSDMLEESFKYVNEDVDMNYDGRGWILPNGRIVSTMNGPHYDNKHNYTSQDEDIRYNFGYERYIGLPPKHRPTDKQLETLRNLLDVFFIDKEMVGIRSEGIELDFFINNRGEFKSEVLYPQHYTSDEVINHIKRIYAQYDEDFKHVNEDSDFMYEHVNEKSEEFPFTLDDLKKEFSNLISKQFKSCGNAFILPDGSFLLSGEEYETHEDFAVAAYERFIPENKDMRDYIVMWNHNYAKYLDAFTEHFNLVRVNDGSNKAVEDRAYFVILNITFTPSQQRALLDYLNYLIDHKYTMPCYTVMAYVRKAAYYVWGLRDELTAEDILNSTKRAIIQGYFTESLNEKEYPKPQKLYDINDTEAKWTDEAEDFIYWGSEADKWHEDYAKYYKVKISPKDFLDLTTQKGANNLKVGDTLGFEELKELDVDELNKEVYQTIFLEISFKDKNNPNKAQVVGHEGRHRMFALMNAGVKSVDIRLSCDIYETKYDKYNPFKLDYIDLVGQFKKSVVVRVYNPIPMSWKQHKSIRPNLKDESLEEDVYDNFNAHEFAVKYFDEESLKKVMQDYIAPKGHSGKCFITRDGTVYDVDKLSPSHMSFLFEMLEKVYDLKETEPLYTDELTDDDLEDLYSELQELACWDYGWMQCSSELGYTAINREPTVQQYESYENWLYNVMNSGAELVQVNAFKDNWEFKTYYFKDNLPEDIIKKIKRFYATGKLIESLHEDLQETDSEGNILSPEQVEFFKNSKARDKQGRLLVCNHYTNNSFTIFDKSRIGSNFNSKLMLGHGFYFTQSNNSYQWINYKELPQDIKMTVYLNIENPYILESQEHCDLLYNKLLSIIENIDDKKLREKCKSKIKKRNASLFWWQAKLLQFIKNNKDIIRITSDELLKSMGFDGVLAYTGNSDKDFNQLVAFESNQIKSITNKNPTSSNNINEDYFEGEVLEEGSLYNAISHYFGNRRKRVSNKSGSGINKGKEPHVDYDLDKNGNKTYHIDNSKKNKEFFTNLTNLFKDKFGSDLNDKETLDLVISAINFICDEESTNFYKDRRDSNKDKVVTVIDRVKEVLSQIEYKFTESLQSSIEKSLEEENIDGLNENNTESIEDISLRVFGEGKLEKGPMYLLPNGKLIDIPEPEQIGLGGLIQYKCHACVNAWLLYKKLIPGTLWDMDDETPLLERGWVKGNLGPLPDSQALMNYIEIPKKKLTDAQYKTILEWLDYAQTIGVKSIEVNIGGTGRFKSYSFSDYTSDEIVNKIKRYFVSGVLSESKQDTLNFKKWLNNDQYADLFIKLRQSFKQPENDYYYWIKNKQPEDLIKFIDTTQKERQDKKEKHQEAADGAEYLGEGNGYKVYHITTWEASKTLGQGAKWCISMRDNSSYWNEYTREGIKFYFFISSQTKYALALYPKILGYKVEFENSYLNKANFEIYTAQDHVDYSVVNQLPLDIIKEEIVLDIIPFDENGLIIKDNVLLKCKKDVTNVTIPSSVTSIGRYAFYSCSSLESIEIPLSVTSIGGMAFYGCINLTVYTNNKYVIDYCKNKGIEYKTDIKEYKENLSTTRDSLSESKQDTENFRKWVENKTQDITKGMTDGNKESYINAFVKFFNEQRKSLKSPFNDYYYWIKKDNWDEFTQMIQDINAKRDTDKKAKEGARLVYSDKDWKVYEITNYEASSKYGKNTKWCITGSKRWNNGESGEKYFKQYHEKENIKFYFFIKNNNEKWALCIYPDNKHFEIFNAEDVKVAYIPDAPLVDEIKVNYNTHNDKDILLNAIMSGKLDDNLLLGLIEEVIYDSGTLESIEIFNNKEDFVDFLDENIPEGYLEWHAVQNNKLTQKEYEEITGDEYPQHWDGDIPYIDYMSELLDYKTKEELLNNIKDYKYWYCTDYGSGYNISELKDYVDLYMEASSDCGINDWDDYDIEDFYKNSDFNTDNKVDIFGVMLVNTLIWKIEHGDISKSVISNIGLSKEFLDSLTLKESLEVLESYKEKVTDKDNREFNIWTECTGGYGEQEDFVKIAYTGDNWIDNHDRIIRENILGYIEYATYKDGVYIQMIEVKESERNKGIATKLLQSLQRDYPNKEINWGYTTEAGTELKKQVTYKDLDGKNMIKLESLKDMTEKLSRDEIEKEVADKLGISKEPVEGPSYILKDGSFLKIWDSDINIKGMSGSDSVSGKTMHLDVDGFIYKEVDDTELHNYYLNKDCIRVNTGFEEYIVLPKETPTEAQYDSLLKWLNFYFFDMKHNRLKVLDYFGSYANSKEYWLSETLPEDIIKKIKRYYVTGNLVEELVESISDIDSEGHRLTKEQKSYFKNSKVVDNKGNLLVCYHGTTTPGFKEFDPRTAKSQFGRYKFGRYNVNYLTTDKDTAIGYTEIGVEDDDNVLACYVNITNPFIVDNQTEAKIRSWGNVKDKRIRDREIKKFNSMFNKWKNKNLSAKDIKDINKDLFSFNCELRINKEAEEEGLDDIVDLWVLETNTYFGQEHVELYQYSLEELFSDDLKEDLRDALIGNYEEEYDDYIHSIDDIIRWVITMNEEDDTSYDGVIVKDIVDIGPRGNVFSAQTTDIITLESSNQIKLITNKNPTMSKNITEVKK